MFIWRRMCISCRSCDSSWIRLVRFVVFCNIGCVKLSVVVFVLFRLVRWMVSLFVVWSRMLRFLRIFLCGCIRNLRWWRRNGCGWRRRMKNFVSGLLRLSWLSRCYRWSWSD